MGLMSFPSFDTLALCLIGAAITHELWGRVFLSIPKGRITRDKWVSQAKIIVSEGLEAFRERAKTNNY